jgi:thioesterase domain-containing protein
MLAVRMFAQIHEVFGVHLPLTCLFQQATIKHLAALIHEQIGDTPWSSLVELRSTGSKPPFFCVHGMTGDVFWFGDLVAHLDSEQPFWGLQSRGLDGIQEPLTSIEAMAAHYVEEIRILQPEGPYYVGGYSFGGSVAYAMACLLRQQGQEVALLAIIDHATPASGYYNYQLSARFVYHFFRNLPYRVQDFFRRRPDQIRARIRRQLLIMNRAAGRSLGAGRRAPYGRTVQASELIDQAPDLPAHVQRVIEANFQAILRYQPPPYAGKLTLLSARGGRLFVTHDHDMGWGQFVTGGVEVRTIPGSHLRLFHPTHVGHLAGQLQQCLNEAQLQSDKD